MRYGNSTSSYIIPLSTAESNFEVTGHLSDTDNGHLSDNLYEILRAFVRHGHLSDNLTSNLYLKQFHMLKGHEHSIIEANCGNK